MKLSPFVLVACLALGGVAPAIAAGRVVVTVANDSALERPAETIVVPYDEVVHLLGGVPSIYHLAVRDAATGQLIPSQVTNFLPNVRPPRYDEILFQHDFAAGEKAARFTIEKTELPGAPFPSKVFARYVPERLDDFAWENDRIAHRIYGPALADPAKAGKSLLVTSGIDVWVKKVRYPIVDRWYVKGHDSYHTDTGEGLDTYAVGTGRGCGGTGVWDGHRLYVGGNYEAWTVLANGPVRAVFELTYAPWVAGNGQIVTERKRFTVDAGHNLDFMESTFTIAGGGGEATVAVGIVDPPDAKNAGVITDTDLHRLTMWQTYPKSGSVGCGVVLDPSARFAGFAEGESDGKLNNRLVLAKVKSGETLRYLSGAGWDRSGDFADQASWEAYVAAWARRLAAPVKVTVAPESAP